MNFDILASGRAETSADPESVRQPNVVAYALSFLAGTIFSAAVVFISPGKPAVLLFLGAALALASVAALVWIVGIPRVVRLLSTTTAPVERSKRVSSATPTEAKIKKPSIVPDRSGYIRPSKKQYNQITMDSAAEYLGDDADELFGVSPSRRVG